MNDYCSICLKEETLSDFAEGTPFTDVEDKTYCVKCFDEMEHNIISCDRCFDWAHRNENFDEHFVKTTNINNDVIHYHIKCLFEYELCPICKTYLKNKEQVDIFIYHDFQIKYHKSCIEDKDNIFKYDICKECSISLQVKCQSCNHRFMDCYNVNCVTYGCNNCDNDRYDGNCGSCNW